MSDLWSRRRAAVQAEAEAEAKAAAHLETKAAQVALEDKSDAEILAELELPDPDSLATGDDISAFMSKAVPDRLRRRALRQLWRMNPMLAHVDGLVDYGEDFTDSATVVENLQTAYQVGKGMLAHIEEMARQQAEKDAEIAQDDAPVAPVEEPPVMAVRPPEPAPIADPEPAPVHAALQNETQENQSDTHFVAPVHRRMRIEFDPEPGSVSARELS
ncbi:MAG: DUF3306 domain-containing protein [Sedimentitalea sp.]